MRSSLNTPRSLARPALSTARALLLLSALGCAEQITLADYCDGQVKTSYGGIKATAAANLGAEHMAVWEGPTAQGACSEHQLLRIDCSAEPPPALCERFPLLAQVPLYTRRFESDLRDHQLQVHLNACRSAPEHVSYMPIVSTTELALEDILEALTESPIDGQVRPLKPRLMDGYLWSDAYQFALFLPSEQTSTSMILEFDPKWLTPPELASAKGQLFLYHIALNSSSATLSPEGVVVIPSCGSAP